jgi:hypothetical protein
MSHAGKEGSRGRRDGLHWIHSYIWEIHCYSIGRISITVPLILIHRGKIKKRKT